MYRSWMIDHLHQPRYRWRKTPPLIFLKRLRLECRAVDTFCIFGRKGGWTAFPSNIKNFLQICNPLSKLVLSRLISVISTWSSQFRDSSMWAPVLLLGAFVSVATSSILQNGQLRENPYPGQASIVDVNTGPAWKTYPPDAKEISYKGRWDSKHISCKLGLSNGFITSLSPLLMTHLIGWSYVSAVEYTSSSLCS